jgi:uncharacterized RDD family membrane protein YckC
MLIAGLVIGTVMLVVYARRRDSFLSDAPVPAGYVLAPLGRRAVAFLIDSSFVSMLFSVLVLMPWLKSHNIELTENWNNQLNTLMAHEPGEFFWRWMMGVAMFVAYGTIFEAAAQGTPGKLLLGLRVFDTKGRRPGFVAVLLRNLLRVEIYFRFDFVPFALLVALTRNRQRLGDLVAQTVVVQKV